MGRHTSVAWKIKVDTLYAQLYGVNLYSSYSFIIKNVFSTAPQSCHLKHYLNLFAVRGVTTKCLYWVGQKFCSGFSIRCYGNKLFGQCDV